MHSGFGKGIASLQRGFVIFRNIETPPAYFCAGGVFHVSKKPTVRLRADRIRLRIVDRLLPGVHIFLLVYRRRDHGTWILV